MCDYFSDALLCIKSMVHKKFLFIITGIASLLLFPEDESGESSQQEDEESDAAETDEQDAEDAVALADEQLERRVK